MDDHQDMLHLKDLFENYARILGQKFYSTQGFNDAYQECVSIAQTLLNLGCQIMTGTTHRTEAIQHANMMEQTVIIYDFNLLLVKDNASLYQPLFHVMVQTKLFGPCTITLKDVEPTYPPLSSQDEEWLRK